MSLQFHINTLKLSLQLFFPDKPTLTKTDFKILITAIFGRTPSDAEVDTIYQNNDQIPRYRIEGVVRDLVYLKRRDLPAEMFSVLDDGFKGYFDVNDLKRVWENAAKKLDWNVVLKCFRELCDAEEKMSYYDFGLVCRRIGLGEEFIVLGDGQCDEVCSYSKFN